jgi:hypothetical protein
MIQLIKELFGAFHITIPPLPPSILTPSSGAIVTPSSPAKAASPAGGAAAPGHGVPLHLIAGLLHLHRIEQLFVIISEPTPSLIEQWTTYPDTNTINHANISLAHVIDDEKLRGFPAAAGFAAAHADALTTTSSSGGNSGNNSNTTNFSAFSSYVGLSGLGETKDEKRGDMSGSMFGLSSPASPIVRQDTRRGATATVGGLGTMDASSISPSLVQGVVGGVPVFTSEITDIPLLHLTHRSARMRISRDLIVVALQARARFDDDSAAQVFIKQFDSKGNLLKDKSGASSSSHRRGVSSGAGLLSPNHPPPLNTGLSLLTSSAGSVLSPQASPLTTPTAAASGTGDGTPVADKKKKGVFGRLFGGKKDKDKRSGDVGEKEKEHKDGSSTPTSPIKHGT